MISRRPTNATNRQDKPARVIDGNAYCMFFDISLGNSHIYQLQLNLISFRPYQYLLYVFNHTSIILARLFSLLKGSFSASLQLLMKNQLIILLVLLLLQQSQAAYCHGKPGQKLVNSQPIWDEQHKLLKRHPYGLLYEIGTGTTTMKLLHAYGSMYQMGLAQGVLLKSELKSFIAELWLYIEQQIEDALPKKIPNFLKKGTANFALGTVLDLNYEITLPYTNKKYYEEMRGIADGSGVDFKYFRRVHMIGELTKGACSMFGAWGKATTNGQTVQLRALDWDFDGPYRKYPLAVVYHPSNKKFGNAWVNIGFVGWIGVLSGVNEHQLAVSEIGVSYPDATFGKESRFGNPFTFVLRDVLQWDKTLDQSIHRMKTTKRTCNLILGVGDGKSEFRSFQYGHSVCNVIGDSNPLPKQDWHKPIQNAVYYGMDWLCPPFHQRLYDMITQNYGKITGQLAVRTIVPGLNSGNLQVVVYDLTYDRVYFAYGYQSEDKKNTDAYMRPFITLDLKAMFAHKNQ